MALPNVLDDINAIRTKYGSILDYYESMNFIKRESINKQILIGDIKITFVPVSKEGNVTIFIFEKKGKKLIYAPCDVKPFQSYELFQGAVSGIQTTGERSFVRGAVVGDKTLIDALVPCADSLTNSAKENTNFKEALEKAAKAAVDGAKSTDDIVARMGRAGTVGERSLGYPDAGAHGLGIIFTEISESMK